VHCVRQKFSFSSIISVVTWISDSHKSFRVAEILILVCYFCSDMLHIKPSIELTFERNKSYIYIYIIYIYIYIQQRHPCCNEVHTLQCYKMSIEITCHKRMVRDVIKWRKKKWVSSPMLQNWVSRSLVTKWCYVMLQNEKKKMRIEITIERDVMDWLQLVGSIRS